MRNVERFDRIPKQDFECDLYIWGTGNTSEMYQEGLKRWSRYNQIKGYVDGDSSKWGQTFNGFSIVSPQSLVGEKNTCVLICTNQLNYMKEIRQQLQSLNRVKFYGIDEFVLCDQRLDLINSYELLGEDRSKELYEYLAECKMNEVYPKEESGLLDVKHSYFSLPEFAKRDSDEVFVDVGCYIGDTVEEYIEVKGNSFKKIYSFEPDKITYNRAQDNIRELTKNNNISEDKIEVLPYGVGSKTRRGSFERLESTDGAGSKFVEGNNADDESVQIISLDEYLKDGFSLLKADVESYEYQVLMGASNIIREQRPKLAMCIYHNVFDFIQLPRIIHELNNNYYLYLRQHAESWCDTVLYAM